MKRGKRAALVVCGILLAVALTVSGIAGLFTRTVTSACGPAYEQKVDSVAYGYQLEQRFVPQYENLDTVKIHVDAQGCAREQGALQVCVLDHEGEQVFCENLPVPELPEYGWVMVPVHVRLEPGRVSTLRLESVGCVDYGPKISFLDARLAAAAEQREGSLSYAGMEVEHAALWMEFQYAVPIEWYAYPAYYAFGLFLLCFVFL